MTPVNIAQPDKLDSFIVKPILPALSLITITAVDPAFAASMAEPIMSPDVVSAEASTMSVATQDAMVAAVFYILLILQTGGAF